MKGKYRLGSTTRKRKLNYIKYSSEVDIHPQSSLICPSTLDLSMNHKRRLGTSDAW